MTKRALAVLALLALGLAGCSEGLHSNGKPTVASAAYPFSWLVRGIGGNDVTLVNLVKPGAEPHDVELSPREVGRVQEADLVVYLHGFQPAVDDAVGSDKNGLDLGKVLTQHKSPEEANALDPHVWLDPVRMQTAADAVATKLADLDPSHAQAYRTRAAAVKAQLAALDQTFRTSLVRCRLTDIVTSHAAFGYLAERYGLHQRGISGLSPDSEPSPRRIAEVASWAKAHHVSTIFFESLVSPKVAQTVASEIGAKTAVLDPVEGVKGSDDYLTVQRRNAAELHQALGCA